jgi:hypothetical protein
MNTGVASEFTSDENNNVPTGGTRKEILLLEKTKEE